MPVKAMRDHNMRAMFLHVLADTLGSVGMIISTVFVQWCACTNDLHDNLTCDATACEITKEEHLFRKWLRHHVPMT